MPLDVMGEPDEDPTKRIYLVRHGETAMNAQRLMRGWDDPALNAEGVQDAQAVAKALEGVHLGIVYSSDLRRAVATMQAIESKQDRKPRTVVTDLLRTIDVGRWTGKPVDEVEPKLAALQRRWETDPDAEAPGGESWAEFQGRQGKVWRAILADPAPNICVVSHLRNSVWALGYALVGRPLAGADLALLGHVTQQSGKISVLTYSKKDGLKIEMVNATRVDEPRDR